MIKIKGGYYLHDYILWPLVKVIPRFIKPNHITGLRFFLTPIVLYLLYFENYQVGVPLFFFTAFTDALDGSMARIRKEITEWGIFFDPVADKILIGSVMVLIGVRFLPLYAVMALVGTEITIAAAGVWYGGKDSPRSANNWGKAKMVFEVLAILALLIGAMTGSGAALAAGEAGIWLSVLLALISLFTYSL